MTVTVTVAVAVTVTVIIVIIMLIIIITINNSLFLAQYIKNLNALTKNSNDLGIKGLLQ